MAINTESPTTFTTAVLIGDAKPLHGEFDTSSPDTIPILSLAPINGEFVDAALEIQSTLGALLIPRMTTLEFAVFNARNRIVDGMIVYNTDTGAFNFRSEDDWVMVGGSFGFVIGPGLSTNNAIVRWNGVSGTLVKDSNVIIDNSSNITGINSIRNGSGLIGSPSYAFTSNSATGMWSSAVGTVDFSAEGVRVLQLNSILGDTNYVEIQSGIAAQNPAIFSRGSDTNIGMHFGSKGTGSFDFVTDNGLQVSIADSGGASTGFITLRGDSAVSSKTRVTASGTATDVGLDLYTKGAGAFDIYAGGFRQVSVGAVASAVNYLRIQGSATGSGIILDALGTDTNIDVSYKTKGTGSHIFQSNSATAFSISGVASGVNFVNTTNAATGSGPKIIATGTDTNVALNIQTKGTGGFNFNSASGANTQFSIVSNNAAVNSISVHGAVASATPELSVIGSDTDISLNFVGKGVGGFRFFSDTFDQFSITGNSTAINRLNVTGAATNAGNILIQPNITALGTDTNIDVAVKGKGTGGFAILPSSAGVAAIARFWNGAGTFYTAIQADANLANLTLTLPITDASANASATATQTSLSSNGTGTLSFSNLTPRYATLTLTSAQVLGMFATPVTLIPAPGAGLMNVVIFFQANLIFNTTAYAGGGNFYLQYGTTSNSNFRATEVNASAAFIRRVASATYSIQGNISDTGGATGLLSTNSVNQAISITNLTGAFTTGNSTVRLQVWYTVVPST